MDKLSQKSARFKYLCQQIERLNEEEDGLLVVQPSCIQRKMGDDQLAELKWLIRLYENGVNGILADELGLGKTLQTISLIGYLRDTRGITGPHMVVAAKSKLDNWMNDIRRLCPSIEVVQFIGDPEQRGLIEKKLVVGKFDVVVTSFEMTMMEDTPLHRFKWHCIIIDEARVNYRIKTENSVFSKAMRLYSTDYRLLITEKPLKNNLQELWSALKFLLPKIVSSAETIDKWFQISGKNDQKEVAQQLHKVLHPLLLQRLKSDVVKGLPPEYETILKVGMSQLQKQIYWELLQEDIKAVNSGGGHPRLLEIAMRLRKCCNHPYLIEGAELGPPGDHLVENSGKMVLLDKLLKQCGSRVLIFCQTTEMIGILEKYLLYRGYTFGTIDGNTDGEDRDASIDAFNKRESEKFILVLSTGAGDLGINFATTDVVIHYDSDWNPQAQDQAHEIGQKKDMQVFRFCTKYTIEEKVIERAYKKLALDALLIEQGRLAEERDVNRDELLQMVRFGAVTLFSSKDSTITDEDIDRIIAKGEASTAELDAKMKKFTEDDFYDFEKDEDTFDLRKIVDNWNDSPTRKRKCVHQSDPHMPEFKGVYECGIYPRARYWEGSFKVKQYKMHCRERGTTPLLAALARERFIYRENLVGIDADRADSLKNFPDLNEKEVTARYYAELEKVQKLKADASRLHNTEEARCVSLQEQLSDALRKNEELEEQMQMQTEQMQSLEEKSCDALREKEELLLKLEFSEQTRRKLHATIMEIKGNLRVICRVRPALLVDGVEKPMAITFPSTSIMELERRGIDVAHKGRKQPFTFDRVFTPAASQSEVFEEISNYVQSALDGYKVCIFAYGQTGSGKTYTMIGKEHDEGLMPRTFAQVSEKRQSLHSQGLQCTIKVSMFEIYNDVIQDLMPRTMWTGYDASKKIGMADFYNEDQVSSLFNIATKKRSSGKTQMNNESSRSHFVCAMMIQAVNVKTKHEVHGFLNLIDLAGSERLNESTDEAKKESIFINKSLTTLGRVFIKMANNDSHVPFRDTVLTSSLQPYLSDENSKTVMVVNISPETDSTSETIRSLKFAADASSCRPRDKRVEQSAVKGKSCQKSATSARQRVAFKR